jgi:serine/threonine protein kinase
MLARLGNYLLVERLNQGGMADVFLAKTFGYSGADQIVALKCIRPEIAEDPAFIRMFVDEAKLAALLDHANIAQTYELGHIDSTYFISMEWVIGRDLRAVIDRARARTVDVPTSVILQVIACVCEGLDYAHRKTDPAGTPLNIVHRDVSPHNILVSYSGEVKLIDFGIAKASTQVTLSQSGVLKGKHGYMSPEQVRGVPVDRRSDIFATGVLFWEMLTSERLFPGSSDFSVLEKVRHAEVYPPTLIKPATHPEIEGVILRALAREPDQRFPSASDMRDAIVEIILKRCGHPSQREVARLMHHLFASEHEESQQMLERARRYVEMPDDAPPLTPGQSSIERAARREQNEGTALTVETPADVAGSPVQSAAVAPKSTEAATEDTPITAPEPATPTELTSSKAEDTPITAPEPATPTELNSSPDRAAGLGKARLLTPLPSASRRRRFMNAMIVLVTIVVGTGMVISSWYWTRSDPGTKHGGVVILSVPEGAQVLIDGVQVGLTPFSSFTVSEGEHAIAVHLAGHRSERRHVQIVARRVVRISVDLQRQP